MKKLFFVLAAGMLTFAACSEFDDSELKGRIDGLEERVGDIETELSELQKSVASLNSGFASLTALLNGGLVTNVRDTKEGDGLEIEITYADGTVKTYTVYHGADGVDGEDGTNGQNGTNAVAPKLTVQLDEATGRYQWYLDGKAVEVDGKPVYATGEKGDSVAGDNGLTPTFVLTAVGADGAPDFSEGADGDVHWFVSYNEDTLGPDEYATAEWYDLGKFEGDVSVTTGMLTVEWENGTLTFTQGGAVIGSYEVVKQFAVVFNMEDEFNQPIVEYGEVRFYAGETKVIDLDVEGGSKNAVVKVELQNPTDEYTVEVKGDKIYVTANVLGAENRLFVDVLDGKDCYHSYVGLVADIPSAGLEVNYGGLLTDKVSGLEDVVSFVSDVDIEVNFAVAHTKTRGDLSYTAESSFKFDADNTEYKYTVSEPALSNYAYIAEFTFTPNNTDYIHWIGPLTYRSVVGKEATKASVTAENVFAGSGSYLTDGVYSSGSDTSYQDGDFAVGGTYEEYLPIIAEWGVYVDITLPADAVAVSFGYAHRSATGENDSADANSANGEIGAIRFGAKAGADYEEIGYATYAHDGTPATSRPTYGITATPRVWRSTTAYALEGGVQFTEVRFGAVGLYSATASNSGWLEADGWADARKYPQTSFNINELEVYTLD